MNVIKTVKSRTLIKFQEVEVYYHYRKKMFSVRDKKTTLVLAHVHNVTLENCIFKVSESGRNRVRQTKQKNVHAWITGNFISANTELINLKEMNIAYYEPKTVDSFVDIYTQKKVEKASSVHCSGNRVYYLP